MRDKVQVRTRELDRLAREGEELLDRVSVVLVVVVYLLSYQQALLSSELDFVIK